MTALSLITYKHDSEMLQLSKIKIKIKHPADTTSHVFFFLYRPPEPQRTNSTETKPNLLLPHISISISPKKRRNTLSPNPNRHQPNFHVPPTESSLPSSTIPPNFCAKPARKTAATSLAERHQVNNSTNITYIPISRHYMHGA